MHSKAIDARWCMNEDETYRPLEGRGGFELQRAVVSIENEVEVATLS